VSCGIRAATVAAGNIRDGRRRVGVGEDCVVDADNSAAVERVVVFLGDVRQRVPLLLLLFSFRLFCNRENRKRIRREEKKSTENEGRWSRHGLILS
jgi:hypothetical protein